MGGAELHLEVMNHFVSLVETGATRIKVDPKVLKRMTWTVKSIHVSSAIQAHNDSRSCPRGDEEACRGKWVRRGSARKKEQCGLGGLLSTASNASPREVSAPPSL